MKTALTKLIEKWESEMGSYIPNAPIYKAFIEEAKIFLEKEKTQIATAYEKREKELFGVVYSAIPYNVEDVVLPDYVREEIANQIMPELSKLVLADVVGRSEQLVCDEHHPDLEHFVNYSESICKNCKQKI
jgi:hypothetical protein